MIVYSTPQSGELIYIESEYFSVSGSLINVKSSVIIIVEASYRPIS